MAKETCVYKFYSNLAYDYQHENANSNDVL